MRRLIERFAAILLMLTSVAASGAGQESAKVNDQALSERLAGISNLHARFHQFTVGRENRSSREQTGELWVAKPDRFRIVTDPPDGQTLVSDGETFWSYDVDLEQVVVSRLQKSVKEVPILLLGGDPAAITGAYRISRYADDDGEHFVLEPKRADSLFRRLTIAFRGGVPASITIVDNLGQQTRMAFIEPSLNDKLEDGLFTFQPPEGVDVIDDRQPD